MEAFPQIGHLCFSDHPALVPEFPEIKCKVQVGVHKHMFLIRTGSFFQLPKCPVNQYRLEFGPRVWDEVVEGTFQSLEV